MKQKKTIINRLHPRAAHLPIKSSLYSIMDCAGKRIPSFVNSQSPNKPIKKPNKVTSGAPESAALTANNERANTPTPMIVLMSMTAAWMTVISRGCSIAYVPPCISECLGCKVLFGASSLISCVIFPRRVSFGEYKSAGLLGMLHRGNRAKISFIP
ncbi:hypothetical protein D3C84_970100 [compost metagenome]